MRDELCWKALAEAADNVALAMEQVSQDGITSQPARTLSGRRLNMPFGWRPSLVQMPRLSTRPASIIFADHRARERLLAALASQSTIDEADVTLIAALERESEVALDP